MYQDFESAEDDAGEEPVEIGVGNEGADNGEQESGAHEVCEGVG